MIAVQIANDLSWCLKERGGEERKKEKGEGRGGEGRGSAKGRGGARTIMEREKGRPREA